MVVFYSKKNCLACKLVRERLVQFKIEYEEVFDHSYSAPTLYDNKKRTWLRPPITTMNLRRWLKS